MKKRTIADCIKGTLKKSSQPLTAQKILEEIEDKNLYEFNTKSPIGVIRQQLRRHCEGLNFPSAMPNKYFFQADKDKYGLLGKHANSPLATTTSSKEKIPEEHIQEFYKKHIEEIKRDLINQILKIHPRAFEKLVLDLLLKMGYGVNGSVRQSKRGPDGGIDGEILQDQLGFDRIYMQAKRYAQNKTISASQIQEFVGAIKGGTRCVFITTSKFSRDAIEFSDSQQQKSLILIDGDRLTQLMIEFGLGIQNTYSFSTYRLDSDYFGESNI